MRQVNITSKYCQPCLKCIFQVYFSLFRNPDMEEAEYLEYDLSDLGEFIDPPDVYNYPPDIPSQNPVVITRSDLQKVLYPMAPVGTA